MPARPPELDILLQDNHLLAVNKPPGLLTQDSGTGEPNLEDLARAWLKQEAGKPGNVYLHAVHRLDRVASGIVLFGRTSKAVSRLNTAFRERRICKIYHALTTAAPQPAAGTLEHCLRHSSRHAEVVVPGTEGAQTARLNYKTLKSASGLFLVEVELDTGRYHQIRAQLASVGCPICGDSAYGSSVRLHLQAGIRLHHCLLRFPHPVGGAEVTVAADYPGSWPGQLQQPQPCPRPQ